MNVSFYEAQFVPLKGRGGSLGNLTPCQWPQVSGPQGSGLRLPITGPSQEHPTF